MFAHIIACTGWTWDYVDEHVTLPRLEAMGAYWYNHPPVHLMLRQFFGLGEQSSGASESEPGNLDELVGMFSSGVPGLEIKDTPRG